MEAGTPVPQVGWSEQGVHVALLGTGGSAHGGLSMRWERRFDGTRIMWVYWVGWSGAMSLEVRTRLTWWLYNEVWWGPGTVELHPAVNDQLRLPYHWAPATVRPDAQLDAHPEAWGYPSWDVEVYQLLGCPPPFLWSIPDIRMVIDARNHG